MKLKTVIIVLCMLLSINIGMIAEPAPASACSCAVPPSPEQQVKDSLEHKTAIFAGTVTAVKQPRQKRIMSSADQVEVTFQVSQVWKGDVGQKTTVYTAMSSASCGYENFEVGTAYIVSAYGVTEQLETGICEMTKPLDSASAETAVLGDGYLPSKQSPESSQDTEGLSGSSSMSLIVMIAAVVIGGAIIVGVIKRRFRTHE